MLPNQNFFQKNDMPSEFEESMRNQISFFLSDYPLYKQWKIDEIYAEAGSNETTQLSKFLSNRKYI